MSNVPAVAIHEHTRHPTQDTHHGAVPRSGVASCRELFTHVVEMAGGGGARVHKGSDGGFEKAVLQASEVRVQIDEVPREVRCEGRVLRGPWRATCVLLLAFRIVLLGTVVSRTRALAVEEHLGHGHGSRRHGECPKRCRR